ncbi:radical SAM protein [Peptococcaceae bacterium]|nr:radical SAM protein [Peptococcaceae bacterium]
MATYLAPTDKIKIMKEKRKIAISRAEELRSQIQDYILAKKNIYTGFDLQDEINSRKKKIMDILGAAEEQWNNWKWQMANRIRDFEMLSEIFDINEKDKKDIERVGKFFRWAASPYYASLMRYDKKDPIWMQAVPNPAELIYQSGVDDPMGEEFTSPAPAITRRYPDRLIINVTNQCAMYCRHCQRRRNIGETDVHKPKHVLEEALKYVKENHEIRDVLITGGDALLLSDSMIDWLLSELDR